MSPTVTRALASILVIGALSITLFAAPAHAVGARDSQWQDTTSWSLFSLDYWLDFARSLFGAESGHDEAVTEGQSDAPSTIFARARADFNPNGVTATSLSPDEMLLLDDGSN